MLSHFNIIVTRELHITIVEANLQHCKVDSRCYLLSPPSNVTIFVKKSKNYSIP